jgi:hypothetical protein
VRSGAARIRRAVARCGDEYVAECDEVRRDGGVDHRRPKLFPVITAAQTRVEEITDGQAMPTVKHRQEWTISKKGACANLKIYQPGQPMQDTQQSAPFSDVLDFPRVLHPGDSATPGALMVDTQVPSALELSLDPEVLPGGGSQLPATHSARRKKRGAPFAVPSQNTRPRRITNRPTRFAEFQTK